MKIRLITLATLSLFLIVTSINAQDSKKGFLMLHMGKYEHAKKIFISSLSVNKGDAQLWYGLGEAYFATQKFDSATTCYQTGTNRKKSHCKKKKKNVSMEKVVCFLSYKISLVFRFRVKREKKTQ